MSDGSILDVTSSAAESVGHYFSVISVIPSTLYVVFVYMLVASDSLEHSPDWGHAFMSLEHLGIAGVAILAILSIGLGAAIHPIQFALVQFFEGYWGTWPISQRIRAQRILHYRRLCGSLENKQITSTDDLAEMSEEVRRIPSIQVPLLSKRDEARRVRNVAFPRARNQIMPTRLGNVLRRAESQAGSQYGMNALQVVPHLLLVAPTAHVEYVNDQRSQLDLAVRMTFMSAVATGTAVLFLWPHGLWVLVAIIPYLLAYLSYRGAVVAGRHYGAALATLINLDRFVLYERLRVQLPSTAQDERKLNQNLAKMLSYRKVTMNFEHPDTENVTETPPGEAGAARA
jgi:hypothetical protein